MANLVIVATPATDDEVWQVSSQKVPHMTLCFLGPAETNPNINAISDYVKEQATRLAPFNLRVDHRGTLGPDEADVLFFSEDISWQVHEFRDRLLADVNIRSAYNAIPQHNGWKPHLTLGYPDTPANKDNWDPTTAQYVRFDKVAVWFAEFGGFSFPLMDNSPKISTMEEDDLAWSALEHHGVKGQKWGVRRTRASLAAKNAEAKKPQSVQVTTKKRGGKSEVRTTGGQNQPVHKDAVKARTTGQQVKKSGLDTLSNQELKDYANRLDLEQRVSRLQSQDSHGKGFIQKFFANKKNREATQKALSDPENLERIKKGRATFKAVRAARVAAKAAAVAAV